jgi:hypothetical protein
MPAQLGMTAKRLGELEDDRRASGERGNVGVESCGPKGDGRDEEFVAALDRS